MPDSNQVLAAVRRRMQTEPDIVLPVLRMLANPDALVADDDEASVSLAHSLNTHRVVARLRELRARSYTTEQVRDMLGGVSRQAVSQRARSRQLLAIEISGRSHFPSWQFREGRPLPHLGRVLRALDEAGVDGLAADAYMTRRSDGRSLAELLIDGEHERVLRQVARAGDQS